MSTSEIADTRYQAHELPPCLGENPSKEALKAYFSSYGWVYVCKIINETSHNITFNNSGYTGEIAPGKQESANSRGYIPYSSADKKYEIKYYNTSLQQWNTMTIKDVDHDWLLSFEQPGVDVDEREVRPYSGFTADITLIINDTGYKIYGCSWGNVQSSLSVRSKWRPV